MLDKTLPYIEFEMKRPNQLPLPAFPRKLPAGFQLKEYQPGDEASWCAVEYAVGEFDTLAEAAAYFAKTFAPYPEELSRRMVFITDKTGEIVATCTAWWGKKDEPLLHWLAVHPSAQKNGLATFLAVEITRRLATLHPGEDLFLHTQTWSYPAIFLYEKLGYQLLPGTKDFEKGQALLAQLRQAKR